MSTLNYLQATLGPGIGAGEGLALLFIWAVYVVLFAIAIGAVSIVVMPVWHYLTSAKFNQMHRKIKRLEAELELLRSLKRRRGN